MNLKGSKTEQNLLAAFAGESEARNKYTFFASQADKEGFKQIAEIFIETGDNEKEHAKRLYKFLNGGSVSPTEDNLLEAALGENHEHTSMYPDFEKIARAEGFNEIADIFKEIGEVEEAHEKRFRKLLDNVKRSTVFKKAQPVKWKCRNCGYIHEGTEPPELCPACAHPRSYYEVLAENY
ncbi:MAG: rubrerythrin family protein [Syntrophomonadaceae bacterium]|nr:rubrerythrin family protein [Syntrophomonadaceae bacterium]MDD3888438.1 rubrerythrin family protein [Syntrophomonadaceae bacterium]MDD4549190.1 rubrerythrin family protein [Syntrophomonadaceae bacterium]